MLIRPLLSLFVKDIIEESAKGIVKREAISQISESVRREFLRAVAEGYTKEVTHNISQYVRSVSEASVTIDSDNSGEKLFTALQSSLKTLEVELEKQGPDSPVVKYLEDKYGKGSLNSLVGRTPVPIYAMVPGYSPNSWESEPWLNRIISDSPEIGEILAEEASRIFDSIFPPSEIL